MRELPESLSVEYFEGDAKIKGIPVHVMFTPDDDGKLVLFISGLSIDQALSLLDGKAATTQPVAQKTETPAAETKVIDISKKAKDAKAAKAETKTEAVKEKPARDTAAPEAKVEVSDAKSEAEIELQPLDVDFLVKQDKLRPVIEHMISRGYRSPSQIADVSKQYLATVPVLQELDKKGDFARRMERNALVVIGG